MQTEVANQIPEQPPLQPALPIAWPKDAKDVRDFFHADFITAQFAAADQTPCDEDRYLISAHDFLSAVNWWANFPHVSRTPQAAPLPLLMRDIARDHGITPAEACQALKDLGNFSVNTAVTAEMAAKLRELFPAPQAAPAAVAVPDAVRDAEKLLRAEAARLERIYNGYGNKWYGFSNEKAAHIEHLRVADALAATPDSDELDASREDLFWKLHSLSKSLESSGRIDQHDQPEAYAAILDAMTLVRQGAAAAPVALPELRGFLSAVAEGSMSRNNQEQMAAELLHQLDTDQQVRALLASAPTRRGLQVTEEMHAAAVKVLHRANGIDGLPQRMLNAMLATATEPLGQTAEGSVIRWVGNGVIGARPTTHDLREAIAAAEDSQQCDCDDCAEAQAIPAKLIKAINTACGGNEWQGDAPATDLLGPACLAIANLAPPAQADQKARMKIAAALGHEGVNFAWSYLTRAIGDLVKAERELIALKSQAHTFQRRVQPWMMACFGPEISADRRERNHRFLEEALELVQSCGCTASEAHQLVDYVYGRPWGEPAQEAGGVMVTLAALCLANGLDMHACGETELARIWTKVEAIRVKQAAKPKHSPLPMHAPQAQADTQDALAFKAAIEKLPRYTYGFKSDDWGMGSHLQSYQDPEGKLLNREEVIAAIAAAKGEAQ